MKTLLLTLLLFFSKMSFSQSVWIMDFAKTKNNRRAEMLYYLENNWKAYRDVAVEKGFIKSYLLLETKADSAGNFDFVLLTEFADSSSFKNVEKNFRPIINMLSPEGPKLLNNIPENDFRQLLFYKKASVIFSSEKTQKK